MSLRVRRAALHHRESAGVNVSNIVGKVGAARRTEAVAIARRAGLI